MSCAYVTMCSAVLLHKGAAQPNPVTNIYGSEKSAAESLLNSSV